MFEGGPVRLTEKGKKALDAYFAERSKDVLRIFENRRFDEKVLELTSDRQRKKDLAFELSGYRFVIDQELYDRAAPMTIDHHGCFVICSRLGCDGERSCEECRSCADLSGPFDPLLQAK